jgi:serine/threonine protein kinase
MRANIKKPRPLAIVRGAKSLENHIFDPSSKTTPFNSAASTSYSPLSEDASPSDLPSTQSDRKEKLSSLKRSLKNLSILSPRTEMSLAQRQNSTGKFLDLGEGEAGQKGEFFTDESTGESYHVIEFLGKGHQARVCKVQRKSDAKVFAAKVLFEKSDDEVRNNLVNEYKILSQLHHSNVIKCECLFTSVEPGRKGLIMIMDFCEGKALKAWIEEQYTRFNEGEILLIMRQIMSAVQYLHGKKVAHRDINFENIMYDRATGRAVLIDFGLARSFDRLTVRQEEVYEKDLMTKDMGTHVMNLSCEEQRQVCTMPMKNIGVSAPNFILSSDDIPPQMNPEITNQLSGCPLEETLPAMTMLSATGTPLYRAPEIMKGEPYTEAIDLWMSGLVFLGVCCWTMGLTTRAIVKKIRMKEQLNLGSGEKVRGLILSMLEMDPRKRIKACSAISDPVFSK